MEDADVYRKGQRTRGCVSIPFVSMSTTVLTRLHHQHPHSLLEIIQLAAQTLEQVHWMSHHQTTMPQLSVALCVHLVEPMLLPEAEDPRSALTALLRMMPVEQTVTSAVSHFDLLVMYCPQSNHDLDISELIA